MGSLGARGSVLALLLASMVAAVGSPADACVAEMVPCLCPAALSQNIPCHVLVPAPVPDEVRDLLDGDG